MTAIQGAKAVANGGAMSLVSSDFTMRVIEYPRNLWQPQHTHEQGSITLVLSGAIEEERIDRTHYALPFTVIVKTPGVPHSDRFGPRGCRTLQIILPRDFELRECGIEGQGVLWHNDGGLAIEPLLRLLKSLDYQPKPPQSDIVFNLYEALDALRNCSRPTSEFPIWLRQTKEFIDHSEPLHPLSMSTIQKHVEIHPVHITRQFKRHFGCTVREYLQYRRIRAAVSFIAESSLTLTEVAYRCKFADQAHFCRAFRRIAKLTASDYRDLAKLIGTAEVENVQAYTSTRPSSLL